MGPMFFNVDNLGSCETFKTAIVGVQLDLKTRKKKKMCERI